MEYEDKFSELDRMILRGCDKDSYLDMLILITKINRAQATDQYNEDRRNKLIHLEELSKKHIFEPFSFISNQGRAN